MGVNFYVSLCGRVRGDDSKLEKFSVVVVPLNVVLIAFHIYSPGT